MTRCGHGRPIECCRVSIEDPDRMVGRVFSLRFLPHPGSVFYNNVMAEGIIDVMHGRT